MYGNAHEYTQAYKNSTASLNNEYNDDGTKLNNIFKNFDNSKCSSERYFFPFYNTAPGYPQWFKDLNCQELKTIDMPIKNIIKEAFSSKKKCKYT